MVLLIHTINAIHPQALQVTTLGCSWHSVTVLIKTSALRQSFFSWCLRSAGGFGLQQSQSIEGKSSVCFTCGRQGGLLIVIFVEKRVNHRFSHPNLLERFGNLFNMKRLAAVAPALDVRLSKSRCHLGFVTSFPKRWYYVSFRGCLANPVWGSTFRISEWRT